MHRIPMPKATLLLVAMGGALLIGQPVLGADLASDAHESTVVYAVPSGTGPAATATTGYQADLPVDDPASATLR